VLKLAANGTIHDKNARREKEKIIRNKFFVVFTIIKLLKAVFFLKIH
jgi:hypothetical protein